VGVNELVTCVGIVLGVHDFNTCPACGENPEVIGVVMVPALVKAVRNALFGCSHATPTFAATTATPTSSANPMLCRDPVLPQSIRYHLSRATIVRYAPPQRSTVQFVISGSFLLAVCDDPPEWTVTDLAFHLSDPALISGSGRIRVVEMVHMHAQLSIDGQQSELDGQAPLSALWGNPPSILDLTICGAPGGGVSCETLVEGSASGYALAFSAVPEATQTPGPTPTATPIVLTRYRVLAGSTIARRAEAVGSPGTSGPLSGTFTVAPCAFIPNTFFAVVITATDLDGGPDYVLAGAEPRPVGCPDGFGVGYMDALTLNFPPVVSAWLRLRINGREVGFSGSGPFDGARFGEPPPVRDLRFCGSSDAAITCREFDDTPGAYELVISAAPERDRRAIRTTGGPSGRDQACQQLADSWRGQRLCHD
jgi:hypothetical protein